jgi:actin-related protein
MTELMFEKFQSSAFFLSKDAVLSCYSVGKTSGLVVDCGGGGTVVTPVVDGWIELKGISRSNLSGRLMDAYMLALVTKKLKTMPKPLYRLQKTVITERNNELQVADNPALANVTRSFQSYMNLELGRDIKEAVCKVTDQPLVENELRYSSLPTTSYELPDGTIIDLGIERFSVPELFLDSSPLQAASSSSTSSSSPSPAMLLSQTAPSFNPLELVQEETAGLHSATLALAAARSQSAAPSLPFSLDSVPKMACDSVFRSDQDSQNTLLANMVLTGGNSSYDGLLERIRFEVERRIHLQAPGIKVKMVSSGNTERSISSWLGGSIVGSLGSFHEIWINRKEYEEFGAHIVDRKCP